VSRAGNEHGYSGGGGGREFNDEPSIRPGSFVVEVRIRSGDRVDAVQMLLQEPGPNGRQYELPKHGGGGGQPQTFRLQQGQYVTRIYGRCGNGVDHIHIVTNLGEVGDGGGGGGDKNYDYQEPPGHQIVGFYGRSGDEVDAIGIVYQKR
jgi:hypothetical protein